LCLVFSVRECSLLYVFVCVRYASVSVV
jgi:hypothetical protein